MVALFGYLSEALRKRPQAPRRVQLQGAHLFGVSNCARALQWAQSAVRSFVLCGTVLEVAEEEAYEPREHHVFPA